MASDSPSGGSRQGGVPAASKPAPQLETTLDLLDRARQGDPSALDQLCARYLPRLRRWATGRLPQEARGLIETDDVVQDVLIKTVRRLDAFEPRPGTVYLGFHGYLRTALLNRIRDEIRLRKNAPHQVELDALPAIPDPGPLPIDRALGREASEQYEAALGRLKADDREAVVMRLELGLSYEEIGEALGKTTKNAARMAVVRALERLIRLMNGLSEIEEEVTR